LLNVGVEKKLLSCKSSGFADAVPYCLFVLFPCKATELQNIIYANLLLLFVYLLCCINILCDLLLLLIM
jgi:hypothetical protein